MPRAVVNEDADVLALRALGWTLSEPERADRLLAVTGIDPDALRAGVGDPAVLAAVLEYLMANEADLVACADDLGVAPTALADAAHRLGAA